MANNVVVKEEIEIKDEICEDLDVETTDPNDVKNILNQNDANGIIGTDNNVAGIFSTETVGSQTLVVFKRLPGPLPQPIPFSKGPNKVNKVIECNQCGKFLTVQRLKLHLQICSKYFECQKCSFKTKYKRSLKKHGEVHLKTKVCQNCKLVFKSLIEFNYHKERCKPKLMHHCAMCPYQSNRKSNFTMHIQRMHHIYDDNIKTKMATHEGEFTRFCLKCNMILESNSTDECTSCKIACHWKCKRCNKVFNIPSSLMYHLDIQCNIKGYYHCPKCEFKSVFLNHVSDHMKSHWKPGSTFDMNSIEWKEVPKADVNKQHIATSEKSIDTDDSTDSKLDNDKHLRMTYGNKKIVLHCEKCNKEVEGDRNFCRKQCEHCQTNVKFRCSICDKLFAQYSRAVEHLNSTCDSQKMIRCSNCDFKAYSNSQILQHYRVFHSDIPTMNTQMIIQNSVGSTKERTFQCAHCPYKGKFKGNIRHHLETCHTKQPIDINENPTPSAKDSQKVVAVVPKKLYHFCFICNKRKRFAYRLKNCQQCKNVVHLWCTICDMAFGIDNPKACEHIKTCLNTFIHECERCARYFSSAEKLMLHNTYQCNKKILYYSCSFCTSKFFNEKNLWQHEQRKHSKSSSQRGKSRKVDKFSRRDIRAEVNHEKKRDLTRAVLPTFKIEDKKPSFFSCQKCNAKFVKNTDYLRHLTYCEVKLNMQCKVLLPRIKIEI